MNDELKHSIRHGNKRELWQAPSAVDTRAVEVVLFEDRAQVKRTATVQLGAGSKVFTLLGISIFVDDLSVEVKARAKGVSVVATRVLRDIAEHRNVDDTSLTELEARYREASRNVQAHEFRLERNASYAERVHKLLKHWSKSLGGAFGGALGGKDLQSHALNDNASMQVWLDSYETLHREMKTCVSTHTLENEKLSDAEQNRKRIAKRLQLARRVEHHYQAAVHVQLQVEEQADVSQPVELEVTYRTPCALWRPEHVATLFETGTGYELDLQTFAVVWQITGESWNDVRCCFSTARPAVDSSPPLLVSDVLTMRRKTDEERKQIVVQQREEQVQQAGISDGVSKVDQMPGVDDGGEVFSYVAEQPYSLVSDGMPVRVKLHQQRLACEVQRVAYPELTQAVHVRAVATLGQGMPLLAGPLWIARQNAIMGRSQTGFVAPGDAFELGMGVDDGVRVRRLAKRSRTKIAVIGTQVIYDDVDLFISNLSDESRQIHVVERYPVSELQDVSTRVSKHQGASLHEQEGMLSFDLELPPGASEQLHFQIEIQAASKVVL